MLRRSFPVLFSLALQTGALAVLIVLPLFFTQVLPNANLRSVLAYAPPPPRAPVAANRQPVVKLTPSPTKWVFSLLPPTARAANPTVTQPLEQPSFGPASDPGGVSFSTGPEVNLPPPAVKPPPNPPAATPKSIHVGGGVAAANLVTRVQPVYPVIAKSVRVQGTVEFRAVISKSGDIEDLQLVSGHPLLVKAAREPILQWKYRPTLLNGQPLEVITQIIVNFTLTQ